MAGAAQIDRLNRFAAWPERGAVQSNLPVVERPGCTCLECGRLRFTAKDDALIDRLVVAGHLSTQGFNDPASRALFALLAREFVDKNAILGRQCIQLSYRPTRNRKAKTTAIAGIGAVGPRASCS